MEKTLQQRVHVARCAEIPQARPDVWQSHVIERGWTQSLGRFFCPNAEFVFSQAEEAIRIICTVLPCLVVVPAAGPEGDVVGVADYFICSCRCNLRGIHVRGSLLPTVSARAAFAGTAHGEGPLQCGTKQQ